MKVSRFSNGEKSGGDEIPAKPETEKMSTERPKDLPFAPPRKLSSASPSSVVGSKSFKELAEKWEKGSTSTSTATTPQTALPPQPLTTMTSTAAAMAFSPKRSFADPSPIDAFLSKYGCDSIDGAAFSSAADEWRSFESSSSFGSPSFYIPDEATEWESFDPSMNDITRNDEIGKKEPPLVFHQHPLSDRKFSVPLYSTDDRSGKGKSGVNGSNGSVKLRDKNNAAPSRPSSLIETGGPEMKEMKVFEIGNLGDHGGRHRGAPSSSNSTSRGSSQV